MQATIKSLPIGEYFKRKPDSNIVYRKEEYCRSEKGWLCGKFDDISYSKVFKGNTLVYVGFTF